MKRPYRFTFDFYESSRLTDSEKKFTSFCENLQKLMNDNKDQGLINFTASRVEVNDVESFFVVHLDFLTDGQLVGVNASKLIGRLIFKAAEKTGIAIKTTEKDEVGQNYWLTINFKSERLADR